MSLFVCGWLCGSVATVACLSLKRWLSKPVEVDALTPTERRLEEWVKTESLPVCRRCDRHYHAEEATIPDGLCGTCRVMAQAIAELPACRCPECGDSGWVRVTEDDFAPCPCTTRCVHGVGQYDHCEDCVMQAHKTEDLPF